jgi:tetratricopeptide (TPR) repeat protein
MKSDWKLLTVVCALVIGLYAYMAQSGVLELLSPDPADTHYNLLVQGFRAGHLSLKKEVPPGFAQLADPYDPVANVLYQPPPYRLLDLSYYKGRFYLYWGVTPALILFWPYTALTGHYLFHRQAVEIFCAIGFLVGVGLLCALWRHYFAEVSVAVAAACALALGLATGLPVLLSQSDVYEVPISCGYMLTMLALGAIWRALQDQERSWRWVAMASAAYGLAVGARPSLLFGAVILLVPVAQAWSERQQIGARLLAAIGPIILIGLGLMLYNDLRFNNPFEFGLRYQLAGERQFTQQLFSLRNLWFNFRVYFLEPAHWSVHSPFIRDITLPPRPTGHGQVRSPFGILTNIPLVWLALAAPLAWRSQSGKAATILRWFTTAVALLFGICALTVGLFWSASFRYEVDFLPVLVLLAVIGILGLERLLADQPVRRRVTRCVWGLLLCFSVVFNLLAPLKYYAEAQNSLGITLFRLGNPQEAIGHWEQALRLNPDYAETHYNLGVAFEKIGRITEATKHYEQALRINPNHAEAHCHLGAIFDKTGRITEAIEHYEQALRINPDYAQAHYNLGVSLAHLGKLQEAMKHWEQAIRIDPDHAEAHNNLGNALLQEGRTEDAIGHYEQALRVKPDLAEAHYNLGLALKQDGRLQEAIGHYTQALRIKPDYPQAQDALAQLQASH